MEFRLTYAGKLLAHKSGRSGHIHDIRQEFHRQLKTFWTQHPVLSRGHPSGSGIPNPATRGRTWPQNGYVWKPMVTEENGLVCALDILMLRNGPPGQARTGIDNRLKTLFDALQMPNSDQLGGETPNPFRSPPPDVLTSGGVRGRFGQTLGLGSRGPCLSTRWRRLTGSSVARFGGA